jgi:hypothetical protein
MTSVSESPAKMAPSASSRARSVWALTRFPLWATATLPPEYCMVSGWAFLAWLTPAVE